MFVLAGFFLVTAFAQTLPPPEGTLRQVQVLVRHGARPPDYIMPGTHEFWDSLGPMRRPGITTRGVLQQESFGRLLRDDYIDKQGFLPPSYNQSTQDGTIYVRASAVGSYGYVLASVEATLATLYPGSFIPVYSTFTVLREDLFWPGNCDSYALEGTTIDRYYNALYAEKYPELLEELRTLLDLPVATAYQLINIAYDNAVKLAVHSGPMPPLLEEHRELIDRLEFDPNYDKVLFTPGDPRGALADKMTRTMLTNIEDAISGADTYKMFLYGTHGNAANAVLEALGIPFNERIRRSDAFILELRERQNGQMFVNARFLNKTRETDIQIQEHIRPLLCPTLQEEPCEVRAFLAATHERLGREPNLDAGEGCCFKSQGFYDFGCDDYLNPATVTIPQCHNYRYHCGATACDVGQVMHPTTFQCIPVQTNYDFT